MKPSIFNSHRSTDIVFAVPEFGRDKTPEAYLTEQSSRDLDGYLGSDMPENHRISANHSHIYIDGDMKPGAKIEMRQGIVSVRSLGENAEISGGMLLIVGDETLSSKSKNFRRAANDYPTILVVPEKERARIFDFIIHREPQFIPVNYLSYVRRA